MKKPFGLVFCIVFFFALWFSAMDGAAAASLSGKLVRLHVLAASDSEADQQMKLRVRDSVLRFVAPALEHCETQSEAVSVLAPLLPEIEAAAEETLRSLGNTETVTALLSEEAYPIREYDTFSLPAGTYESLRVLIGPGEGHNWWCVVFPPLCLSAAEDDGNSADDAWEVFSPAEQRLISGSGRVIRLKALEWWQKVKNLLH